MFAATDWMMTTDEAVLFVRRNLGLTNILVIATENRALVWFDHDRAWSFIRASTLAQARGYDSFSYFGIDGKIGGGRVNGLGSFEQIKPVVQLLAAA